MEGGLAGGSRPIVLSILFCKKRQYKYAYKLLCMKCVQVFIPVKKLILVIFRAKEKSSDLFEKEKIHSFQIIDQSFQTTSRVVF